MLRKATAADTWTLNKLTEAATKGAVCLDGSPGAFYIRTSFQGIPADPTKWIIFMEGGGWAYSDESAYERSATGLGSSTSYPEVIAGHEGDSLFGTTPFNTFNVVYVKYCDGGSFTGALDNPPVMVQNSTDKQTYPVYYRGRGILDAVFDELFTNHGLTKATELLFAGCSAGGLTAYIHTDYVAYLMSKRAPQAVTVGLGDAMFSLNHLDFGGDHHWPEMMQWVYSSMDPNGLSNNDVCVSYMADTYGTPKGNRSEGWRCMFGSAVAPFIQRPFFVLNSKYDTWQAAQIIGAGACGNNISSCDPDLLKFWVDYGNQMLALADSLPARHGVHINNCQHHCQTGLPNFAKDSVEGQSMADSIVSWYKAAIQGNSEDIPRKMDRCDVEPCEGDVCSNPEY